MAIARSTGAFLGTDESTFQTITLSATANGAEKDLLGDNVSIGDVWLYCVVQNVAISSIDIKVNNRRVTGQAYAKDNFDINVPTINGTKKVPLGKFPASRFMQVDVKNNDGTNTVSVFIGYELEKVS
jgi:hypothetical protein